MKFKRVSTQHCTLSFMKIIGHRGAKGLAPENTIASFKKAIELDVDQIEFDVRTSKDNIPIVHHNGVLKDASGNRLRIVDHNYTELKNHKFDLLTLQEALEFINGLVDILVEAKPGVKTEPIAKVLKDYRHLYHVGSKSQKTLLELHRLLPSAPVVIIERWSGIKGTWRARQLKTKQLLMFEYFLWSGFIKSMKKSGYQLYVYPLNNPKKAKRWARYGIAGVVTDFPDRYLANKE